MSDNVSLTTLGILAAAVTFYLLVEMAVWLMEWRLHKKERGDG